MPGTLPALAERPPRGRLGAWVPTWLLTGLVVLPAVAAVLSLAGRRWFPSGDEAFIARRVADVGGRHTPLVGVYSRFGWDHPGPLIFWLLAPFERVGGDTGILVGTAGINAACLGGAVLVACRRGGVALAAWVALFLAVLCHSLGAAFLLDPWNPWLPVTGLALFVLVAWSVCCGDTALWPLLVAVGSWEIQCHVGFAPVVLAVAAFVVVGRGPARRLVPAEADPSWARRPARTQAGRRAVLVGLVGLGLWAGPIVQQVTGRPGNLEALLRFSQRRSETTFGFDYGVHLAARQLSWLPPWATGRDANALGLLTVAPVGAAAVEVGLLALSGWLAGRRHRRDAAALAAVVVVAVLTGVIGVTRLVGVPFPYLVRWMWVVAMFVPLAIGWCLLEIVRPHARVSEWVRTGTLVAVVVAALAFVVVTTAEATRPALPGQPLSNALAGVVPAVERSLDRRRGYLLESSETDVLGPALGPGLLDALERGGDHVSLLPAFAAQVGAWRTTPERPGVPTIMILSATDPTSGSTAPPGGSRIAHWDPLSPTERARASALAWSVRAALGARLAATSAVHADLAIADADYVAHGAAVATLADLADLERRGQTYDIYLIPP